MKAHQFPELGSNTQRSGSIADEVRRQWGHTIDSFLRAVRAELDRANRLHGSRMASAHEAYAVILEELEEFKAEVFKKARERDEAGMIAELVQIAAMCAKAAISLECAQ